MVEEMSLSIKEMRMKTGLSQAKFAETFNIPVSTLRKWEQGDSSPSGYVIDLIARAIPSLNSSLEVSIPVRKKIYINCSLNSFLNVTT